MQLSLCVYNVENLFIKAVSPEVFDRPLKEEKRLKDLAFTFNEIDADIFALTEVGGIDNLKHFNIHYLEDKYYEVLIPGNSNRGIELGFLIKKGLPFKYDAITYKKHFLDFNYPHELKIKESDPDYKLPKYRMSRDLLELRFFDDFDSKKEYPKLIIFLVHLKSGRDPEGIDFRSIKRRKAELEFALSHIKKVQGKNHGVPILFCGDFNGNASRLKTDEEFHSLEKSRFIDVLETRDLPPEQKATYYIFNRRNKIPIQLDYAFIDEEHQHKLVDACVYRYKNEHGNVKRLPRSKYDVWNNPSDHYPIVFTIDL